MESQHEHQQYILQAKSNRFSAYQDGAPPITGKVPPDESRALARVVAVDDHRVWLEPMQTGSCGGCASAAACGAKGIGTLANRLEARRFAVSSQSGLQVGELVEVAFGDRNLVKAAAVAYVIPLLFALVTAAIAQSRTGQDGLALLGALLGLAFGFAVMKIMAARLEARGVLQARIVRRHEQVIQIFQTGAECNA